MAVIGDPKSDSSEDQRLALKSDGETGMELETLLKSSQEELILRDLNVQTAMTQNTVDFRS